MVPCSDISTFCPYLWLNTWNQIISFNVYLCLGLICMLDSARLLLIRGASVCHRIIYTVFWGVKMTVSTEIQSMNEADGMELSSERLNTVCVWDNTNERQTNEWWKESTLLLQPPHNPSHTVDIRILHDYGFMQSMCIRKHYITSDTGSA